MRANIKIKYSPHSESQHEFHKDLHSNTLAYLSGLGSGKSHALMMKLLKLSWLNRGFAGGLLCPSVEDFKKDMLPLFEETFENHNLQKYCYYHRQDKCFKLLWSSKPIYIFSGEKSIAGPNLAYCGINEPSIIKYERVNEMLRRVRIKRAPNPQKLLAGTPEDRFGWLQDYVEKQENLGRLKVLTGRTVDNPYLDDDYIEHLRTTLDPQQFKVFAEGQLIFIGSNLFYYAFDKTKNTTDMVLDKKAPIFINLDFNVGNMHATISQLYENKFGKTVAVFCDEIVLKEYGADTYAMINAIKAKFPKMERQIKITCDFSGKARKTTGPSDVKVLKTAFGEDRVRYRTTGNPRVRRRQLLVNGLLHHSRILVNPEKCPALMKDIRRVEQDVDFSKKKNSEDLTHASDSMDYFIDFELGEESVKRYSEYRAM